MNASRLRALLVTLSLFVTGAPMVLAAEIRVVTEELPPYNMTVDGRLTGMSTEVVEALLAEAGEPANIRSMPWARAYDIAQNAANVMIYSITRTTQREPLFKWVGTVAPSDWYLYALKERNLHLSSLEQARDYQTATVKEDAGEQFLSGQGFILGRDLQSSNRYELNYEKLKSGRVDLWISNELNARYLVREAGDDPDKMVVPVLALPQLNDGRGLSIAFSRQTPDETVRRFRDALQRLRANGTYDAILRKWL